MEQFSVIGIANRIPDETSAYVFLEDLRWGDDPSCPHCDTDRKPYFLTPKNGETRKTTRGTASPRRVWKCAACRKQFSVLTGTIFHGTKISVRTWVFVIFEMCANKNGLAAREIERKYDVTAKTAWFMLHRIREAMKREPLAGMLGGNGRTVVADETFIGGKPKNKHRSPGRKPVGAGAKSGPAYDKVPVLSLIDTATGEARSKVVNDVTGHTLRKAIAEQVDMAGTVLHTDAAPAYKKIAHEFVAHQSVDHSAGQYVRYEGERVITSNQAEGYFSQLKRSLDGTHHHVSTRHLPRYLAEFDYRYSTRKLSDTQRMRQVVGRIGGRRLSYRPLTER